MSQQIFPIGPLSGTTDAKAQASASDSAPAAAADVLSSKSTASSEEHKKTIPLIWIPVVICLGLLIAAGYLGGRIFASKPRDIRPVGTVAVAKTPISVGAIAQTSAAQSPASPIPAAAQNPTEITAVAPVVDKPAPAPELPVLTVRTHDDPAFAPPDDLSVIHPNPGDRYVQISALNTAAAHRYVDQLRHGPLEPHLAQGPTPTILRVLIGPFSEKTSLLNTMSELKAAGIDCFIREY